MRRSNCSLLNVQSAHAKPMKCSVHDNYHIKRNKSNHSFIPAPPRLQMHFWTGKKTFHMPTEKDLKSQSVQYTNKKGQGTTIVTSQQKGNPIYIPCVQFRDGKGIFGRLKGPRCHVSGRLREDHAVMLRRHPTSL